MRADLLQETVEVLEEFNFNVLVYLHSCFDIAAQKKELTLLIKVLENIDGFREEHAEELKKLAASLGACPLIVGEKSKAANLLNSTIYDRYDIPVITLGSLQSTLLGAYPEKISSKGRIIAEISGDELRKAREKKNISAEQLANELKLNRESIYLYENDKIRAKYEIARKIENFLNAHLINATKPFQVFHMKEEKHIGLSKKIALLDFDVSSFQRMNFDLLASDEKNRVMVKQGAIRNPEKMVQLSDFFNSFFTVVSDERIKDLPVITKKEMELVSSKKDFLKLVKEKS